MYAIWTKDDAYTIAFYDGSDLPSDGWTLFKPNFFSWMAAHDFIMRMI